MTRSRSRLRTRFADPAGFVIPIVMIVLLVITLLVSAAVIQAVSASGLALRDSNAKRAEQAADAGLRMATFEYDISAVDLLSVASLQSPQVGSCVTGSTAAGIGVTANSVASPPWCGAVVEDLGDGESYSYQASPATQISHLGIVQHTGCSLLICTGPDIDPYTTELERTVVSTGTAGGVTRRVAARMDLAGTVTAESCSGIIGCLLDAVLGLLGVNPGAPGTTTGANITQSYVIEPGSYRQCPAAPPSGSDPSSNCRMGPSGIS